MCITLFSARSYDKLDDDSRIVRFLKDFYFDENYTENHPSLSAGTGLSNLVSHDPRMQRNLAPTYNLDFSYGYARYYKIDGIDNFLYRRGEFITVGNISRNFKTFRITSDGINTDSWRFGAGLKDGYILVNKNAGDLSFLHSSAFMLARPDFDDFNSSGKENEFLDVYKRRFKFGTMFSSSIEYSLTDIIHVEASYDKLLIQPVFEFYPWFGSWIVDNVLQRWVDIYEDVFLKNFGRDWAWIKFIYKTGISVIFYKLREHNGYFPFNSEPTVSSDAFKLNIELIF